MIARTSLLIVLYNNVFQQTIIINITFSAIVLVSALLVYGQTKEIKSTVLIEFGRLQLNSMPFHGCYLDPLETM